MEAVDSRSLLRSGHARFGVGKARVPDAPERWRPAGWLGGADASAPITKLFVDIDEKLRMIACVQEEMTMTDRQPPRPTDAELAILGVLWERGPSTVRDVHEQLNRDGATGYTTILKLLQIMTEKGLVVRDESERAHVYESRYGEQKTQRQLLADLAERAFGGSATKLVMQALSGRKSNAAELNAIRELLDTLEGESR